MAKNDKKGDKKTKMTKKQDKKQKMGFIPYKKGGHNRISRINRDTPSSYGNYKNLISGKPLINNHQAELCKFYCPFSKSCTKRNGDKNKGKTPCLYKPKNQHKCEKAEFVGENGK